MSLADQQWCPTSVQVTVLQARGLRIKGKSGTNDAYAVMQVGKEKYQTSVVEKSVAPVWKEEAAFDLPPLLHQGTERSTLHVHVLHRALVGPDKLLGQAVINLLQLSEDKTRNKTEWFKLLDKTGKPDKDRGEVLLDVQFMRNNMTASMFDLSAAGKSRSRLGKFKDKVRGKKKESDSASGAVPPLTQVLTDSEEEATGEGAASNDGKKKKHKMKSLFSPKSNLQKSMSQSMSVLPAKNSSLSSSQSSGLNVDSSEGKKKFKFKIHKRSGSSDGKDSSSGHQKQIPAEQSNLCINGSHIYCEEPQSRASRIGSSFSLTSSGHGSMEDVPENSPPSVDALKTVRQYSPWKEEEEEMENIKEDESMEEEDRTRREEEMEIRRQQEELKRLAEEEVRRKAEEERARREEEERIRSEVERRRRKEEEEERVRRQQEELQRLAEEKRRQEEEMRRRAEEEERIRREEEERVRRQQEEERERLAEKQRRQEEEERRRAEEERVKREEEERVRREEEERFRKEEEERERLVEEQRRQEEEERVKREEEERARRDEEARVRREEELERLVEEKRRQEEEERSRAEQERKQNEERIRKKEEERARKEKEEYERLMEEKRRLEEERKRIEEEERKKIQEEEKRQREEEEKRRQEEMRLRMEEERIQQEMRRQEELKLAEEKRRLEEEERRKIEEERRREEEEMVKRQQERQREEEERIRKEELRRQEEEERARKEKEEYERLMEEKKKLEEERKRIEEEEKIRKEEMIRMEEEKRRRRAEEEERSRAEQERKQKEEEERIRKEEEERARKEKEEYERLMEEKKKLEEERKRIEEEERIKKEEQERIRMEEEARRKKEEMERLAEERRRLEEEEARRIEKVRREEEERIRRQDIAERERREEEARRLEKEKLTREAEEQEKKHKKTKDGQRAVGKKTKVSGPAEVASTNPFDEDFSNNPFDEGPEDRCEPAASALSTVEKELISAQRENKRQAPQPPGRNQAEKQSQREQDVSTQHLAQMNKQSKDKDVKTVSVLPQRSVQMITPLSKSPTDSKNTQSLTQSSSAKGPANTTKHTKRPAPSRPRSVEEEQPSELKTASSSDGKASHRGVSETTQVQVSYGLNPFEDDEDENELAAQEDATVSGNTGSVRWPPAVSQTADKDSETKIKSSKVARAPLPPAKSDTTLSTAINQHTERGLVTDDLSVTVPDNPVKQARDPQPEANNPVQVHESPLQEPQSMKVVETGVKEAPPTASRRLQPVRPLEQQSAPVVQEETDDKSTENHSGVQDKTKVNDTGVKGPYSQLTHSELVSLVLKQENQLSERDKKISELEQYIDNLLVRVIEEQPSLLMSLSALKKAA